MSAGVVKNNNSTSPLKSFAALNLWKWLELISSSANFLFPSFSGGYSAAYLLFTDKKGPTVLCSVTATAPYELGVVRLLALN